MVYLYELSSSVIGAMPALSGLDILPVFNKTEEYIEAEKYLIKYLNNISASIVTGKDETGTFIMISGGDVFWTSKRLYFQKRLEDYKRGIDSVLLEDFMASGKALDKACGTPNISVFYNGNFISLDDFIRQLPPETKVYIGNIMLIPEE